MKASALEPAVTDLYDLDFFEWTSQNAKLLRVGKFQEADIIRIAEELEDMGKRERRELLSRLHVLLSHLLKWQIQPAQRSRSWRVTINVQRREIGDLVEEMPSLRAALAENLPKLYSRSVADAVDETGLVQNSFPEVCPFRLDQILDTQFFPD